ncbi:hypothetical protein DIPPA_31996 [Diplonema papillatum]|nr:hypothetical protein DIPPA_31996 [Diplonema papillatum]
MDSSYMDAHDDPGTENAEEEVGYPFTFQALSRGLSADFRNHLLLLEENEPLYLVHALLGLELGTITREEAKVAMLLAAFEWEKIQHEKNGGDRKTDFADALLSHSAFKVHDVLSVCRKLDANRYGKTLPSESSILSTAPAGQRKLIESEAKRFKRYHIAEAGELPKDHVAERNTITSPATLHVEGSEYKTVGSARHPPVFGGAGAAQQRRLRLTAASLTTVDAMSAAFAPELPKKEQNCAKKLAELMFKKDRLARDLLPDHPTQTLSGKMEKRLQYWFVGQTKATLEKALLEHALGPWKQLADLVHVHPSMLAVPEFLTCAFTPTRARPPHLEYALRLKAVHTEDLRRLTANKPPVSYLRKKFVKEPIPAKLKRAILDYASVPEVLQNMSFLLSNETNDQITQMLDEISTEEVTLGDTLHAACVTYFRKSPVFSTLITLADQKIVAEGTMLQGTVRVVLDNVRDELLTNDNVFKKAFLAGLFAVLAGTPLMVISRDRGGVTVSIMEYRLSLTTVKDAFIMAWTMQQAALARRREMSREKVQNKPGPKGLAAFEAMLEQAEKFCDVQGVLFFTVDREREALGAVRGQMLEDFARRWKDRMPGTPLILSVAETAKMQTAVKLTSRQNQVQILRKRKLEYTPPREATAMCSYYLRQLLLKSIALDANIWHVPIIDAGAKDATGPVTHFQSTADRVIHVHRAYSRIMAALIGASEQARFLTRALPPLRKLVPATLIKRSMHRFQLPEPPCMSILIAVLDVLTQSGSQATVSRVAPPEVERYAPYGNPVRGWSKGHLGKDGCISGRSEHAGSKGSAAFEFGGRAYRRKSKQEAWRLEQEQLARQQQPQKGKGGKGAKGSKQGKAGKSVPPSGSSSTARVEALKGVVAALAEFSATGFLRGVDTKRLADLAIRPSVESVIAVCQSAGLRGPSVQDASIESGDRARGMCDAHPLDNPLDKTAWMPPMIFAFLSDGELLHVSRVCRHWLQIGNEVGFDRLVQAFYPYAEGLQNLAKKGFVARMGNKACMLALSEAHGNEDTAVKLLTKKYKSYPKASPDRI